jgi:hypothetical protein
MQRMPPAPDPAQPAGPPGRPGGRSAAGTARLRLRWLLVVIGIMVVLTAGWPLINTAVSARHTLRPGTRLTVGPGSGRAGQITVGPGWSLLQTDSTPQYGYQLRHGAVGLAVDYVALLNPGQARHLWAGLRQLLKIEDPGVQLGKPAVFTSAYGRPGISGKLSGPHQDGTASIFGEPGRRFAVEMIMLAPRTVRHSVFRPGLQIMRSLRLPPAPPP